MTRSQKFHDYTDAYAPMRKKILTEKKNVQSLHYIF